MHIDIMAPVITVFDPFVTWTIRVKDKWCSFTFEVHIEVTNFGRRKENHVTT